MLNYLKHTEVILDEDTWRNSLKRIFENLLEKNIIGEKHTSEDNAVKCLPKRLRGEARKFLKKLIREGYVLPKPTSYGMEVSLNPHRIMEIRMILSET